MTRTVKLGDLQAVNEAASERENPYPPAPNRVRKEWDDEWNAKPDPICPLCRRPAPELFPFGFWQKRVACAACIARRNRLLETKARIIAGRDRRAEARFERERQAGFRPPL